MENLYKLISQYKPKCEQEEADKKRMLAFLLANDDALLRTNTIAHFTASSWIYNEDRSKSLLVYHNIYDSWSWTGGHADGDADLLRVALKEAIEETGVKNFDVLSEEPLSLEIITVDGHEKKGVFVPSHLHMNVTFALMADEKEKLVVCEGENKDVKWFDNSKIPEAVSEPWMLQRIYRKFGI